MPLVLMRPVARPPRKPPGHFSVPEALAYADAVLAGPESGFSPRVAGVGQLVHRFVLPLDLAKTTNQLISMVGGRGRGPQKMSGAAKSAAYKDRVWRMMSLQCMQRPERPLTGRAFVRAIRFSSHEPDQASDGGLKVAIDCLRVPVAPHWDEERRKLVGGKRGLGILIDDAQRYMRLVSWFEKVAPGRGMALLEVWSGETT